MGAAARLGEETEAEETRQAGGEVGRLHLQPLRGQVRIQEETPAFLREEQSAVRPGGFRLHPVWSAY